VHQRLVGVLKSSDTALIEAAVSACTVLGIGCRRRPYRTRALSETWRVLIYGRLNLETLLREVPLQVPRKRARIEAIVAAYTRPHADREFPELAEAIWLYEGGLSLERTARRVGYSTSKVRCWLRRYGVAMRRRKLEDVCSRGHDLTQPRAIVLRKNGGRACRKCQNASSRERAARRTREQRDPDNAQARAAERRRPAHRAPLLSA
jgi:hypothetical protein